MVQSVVGPPAPPKGPEKSVREPVPIVEWRGNVPQPFAEFMRYVSPWDLPELYGVVGRFLEVRELVNIARRIHQVFERGPHTAASGRWSFEEYMAAKDEIGRQIRALHRRVNEAAVDARVISSIPFSRKEAGRAGRTHLETA
jgi:hypothetical protein